MFSHITIRYKKNKLCCRIFRIEWWELFVLRFRESFSQMSKVNTPYFPIKIRILIEFKKKKYLYAFEYIHSHVTTFQTIFIVILLITLILSQLVCYQKITTKRYSFFDRKCLYQDVSIIPSFLNMQKLLLMFSWSNSLVLLKGGFK